MRKIVLIGCASQKLGIKKKMVDSIVRAKAIDMYMPSNLFRLERMYAEKVVHADEIYILSAKYHLLDKSDVIETYNMFLGDYSKKERVEWSNITYNQILQRIKPKKDDVFIFLCGKNYYEFLLDKLDNKYLMPLEGLTIGKQIKFLKEELND